MISAILLAAGRSKRMAGVNKLTKEIQGIPLIKHSINNIILSSVNEIIIVLGYQKEIIEKLIDKNKKIKIVHNKNFDSGMASSIKLGLNNLSESTESFFICLGDATFLNGLYTLFGRVSSGMDYVDMLSKGEPPAVPDTILSLRVADDIVSPEAITFFGGSGDDSFTGGSCNDTINGGLGTDVVVFSGEVSTYTITEVGNTVVITDSQSSRDGSDSLFSIEQFQFSDGTFQLSELLNVTDIDRGIYRFFNVDTGTHFLSGSTVERDSVINNLDAFNFEGPTFRAADPLLIQRM